MLRSATCVTSEIQYGSATLYVSSQHYMCRRAQVQLMQLCQEVHLCGDRNKLLLDVKSTSVAQILFITIIILAI